MKPVTSHLRIATTWGPLVVSADGGRITGCDLPMVRRVPRGPFRFRRSLIRASDRRDRAVLKQADRWIRGLLAGRALKVPPVREPEGTKFQQRIWRVLRALPAGRTLTYGEVARRAGRPRAVRAAGAACGANPVPLFIPCHRVIGAGGALGGFSSGLAWKKLLLKRE